MGDEIRKDEITEEELEGQTGGKKTSWTNEPLKDPSRVTTLAVGEEEEQSDAGDRRRTL